MCARVLRSSRIEAAARMRSFLERTARGVIRGQHSRAETTVSQDSGRGWPGRRQEKGLVAQVAAEPRMAPAPCFEVPGDRIEQLRFVRRRFPHGRPAEESCANLRV